MKLHLFAPVLALAPLFGSPLQDPSAPQEVVPAELGATVNVHRSGDLWFAGQFTPEDVAVFKEQGLTRVITARTAGEVTWDERQLLEDAGIEFVSVPFRQPDSLTDDVFGEMRELLAAESGPTLFHCGSANRVGAAWLPFRVLDQGVPLERALAEAKTIGLSTEAYQLRAIAYIERERARGVGREKSVKEGINDAFKDADLDVEKFLGRFEVESREVFASRHEIMKAAGIQPGMRIADVGAGTGLFTFLFSETVAADGWVYAVDIAPRFLERIRGIAGDRNVANITGVLCAEDSIGLPPASVDLAFVCDVYHHFEFPHSTMTSIHRALQPDGRLIVIDFDRIPGTSSEWVLGHVRAPKEDFRAEIERAGFQFVRQIEVKGLKDNYFLEFAKAEK